MASHLAGPHPAPTPLAGPHLTGPQALALQPRLLLHQGLLLGQDGLPLVELLPQLLQCPPLLQDLFHLLVQPLLLLLDLLTGVGEGTQLSPLAPRATARGQWGRRVRPPSHPPPPPRPRGTEAADRGLRGRRPGPAHLLLLQADHRAVAAAAPLPLERRDLFRLDLQDLLLLLVPPLQLLGTRPASSSGAGSRGGGGGRVSPEPLRRWPRHPRLPGTGLLRAAGRGHGSPPESRPPRVPSGSPHSQGRGQTQGGRAAGSGGPAAASPGDPRRPRPDPTLTRCCRLFISVSRRRFCSVSSRSRLCSCPCCCRMSCTCLSSSCSRFSLWADSDASRSVACFFSFSTWTDTASAGPPRDGTAPDTQPGWAGPKDDGRREGRTEGQTGQWVMD